MIHKEPSPLAGVTVIIKDEAFGLGKQEFEVEDWFDRVTGKSWMFFKGNLACMQYAIRSKGVPIDNEVLYGKIKGSGYLVHISEIKS